MVKRKKQDEHMIPLHDLYTRLNSDPERGLTSSKAAEVLLRDGPNALTLPQASREWVGLLRHLFWGSALPLWIGAAICFAAYATWTPTQEEDVVDNSAAVRVQLYMGLLLCAAVVATGLFNFYREANNTKLMEAFTNRGPQSALVLRDGQQLPLSARECVAGDIVEVKEGDVIPADIRLISGGCKVTSLESSAPTERTPEHTSVKPLEARNLALFYTRCVEGGCRGIVLQTGSRTVLGKMTDLRTGMGRVIHILTGISVFLCLAYFVLAFILGYHWLEVLITTLVALVLVVRCLRCLGLFLRCRNNHRIAQSPHLGRSQV